MGLPKFISEDQELQLLQTAWAAKLDPLLANVLSSGQVLKGIQLQTGTNVVNHKLGRKLQGWFFTRQRAAATVFDTQDSNATPALTLQLTASTNALVDIYVF